MAPMSRRAQADDERRLSVQQTASRVLLEQASLDEAMAEILRALATELDWSLAVYWVVAPGALGAQARFQCRAIWAAEPIVRTAVVEASRAAVLKVGRIRPGVPRRAVSPSGSSNSAPTSRAPGCAWPWRRACVRSPPFRCASERASRPSSSFFPGRAPRRRGDVATDDRPRPSDLPGVSPRGGAGDGPGGAGTGARGAGDGPERAPDGITVRDGAGRLVYANAAIARAVGLPELRSSPAELFGRFPMWDENGRPLSPDEIARLDPPPGGEERLLRYRPSPAPTRAAVTTAAIAGCR